MKKENVKDIGCWIPPEILSRKDLTSNEKLIAGRILGLSVKSGFCYATNKWLGEQFGLSSGSMSNIVSSLVKKAIIKREVIRNDRKQIIQRKLYPVSTKKWIPINKKVEDSNKDMSNRVNNDNGFSAQKSKAYSIDKHLEDNPSEFEEINQAIRYYVDTYEERLKDIHPRITKEQFEKVKDGFMALDENIYPKVYIGLHEYKKIIDSWFEDVFVESDYNILHFTSGEVMATHYFKAFKNEGF